MLAIRRHFRLASIALLAVVCHSALAAGHGGKGHKGKGKGDEDNPERQIAWQDTYESALEFAVHGPRPVMVVITRDTNEDDLKMLDLLADWPAIDDLSKKDAALLWQTNQAPKGKELIAQFNVKSYPYVVWLDQYGNALFGQSFPGSANDIQSVVQGWKSTLTNVTKYLYDRITAGDKLRSKGRLRAAYQEYSLITPFKGPLPDQARVGKQRAFETWTKLAQLAGAMPASTRDRAAMLKGVVKETEGLDCAKLIAEVIARASQPPAAPAAAPVTNPVEVAQGPATGPAAETGTAATGPNLDLEHGPQAPVNSGIPRSVAAAATPKAPQPAQPAHDAGPQVADIALTLPPTEIKPLKQLASAPVHDHDGDDTNLDLRSLANSSDERLKGAGKLVATGLDAYKKACSDSMDRGEARNALLKQAHDAFEEGLKQIDAINTANPNPQLDGAMTQISMLMYGCLKYQSL